MACKGLRLFFEENVIKRPLVKSAHLGIWKKAVLTTRAAMDSSVVAHRPNAALQGGSAHNVMANLPLGRQHITDDGGAGGSGVSSEGRWQGPLHADDPAPLSEAW